MTRPGTVAEQPTMPSKANIERLREPSPPRSPQRNAAAAFAEVEGEFSELLSKLKMEDGQRPEEPLSADRSSRPTELKHVRRREVDARIARSEGDASLGAVDHVPSDDPQVVSDPHPKGITDTPEPEPTQAHPLQLDAAAVDDIAAMIKLTPVQPTGPSQAADPKVASGAIPQDNFAPSEARPAIEVARTGKGQVEQKVDGPTPLAAPDLNFASASVSEAVAPGGQKPPVQGDVPKASVVRRESHFAPVSSSHAAVSAVESGTLGIGPDGKGRQSVVAPSVDTASPSGDESVSVAVPPARQIADRVTAEAAVLERADPAGATPDEPATRPVLKVLQIQLQPADLGTITVRMELKQDGLKLHVEADRPETVEIIRGDQDTLSKLLRSAGYGVDPGSIRIVEGDRTVAAAQAGQQGTQANLQSSTQSQPGWSERQERAQRGNTGADGGDAQAPTNRNEIHETTTNRTGRDLYV